MEGYIAGSLLTYANVCKALYFVYPDEAATAPLPMRYMPPSTRAASLRKAPAKGLIRST
jgi:hypothetical protein